MKRLLTCFLLALPIFLQAQVLEVPTLKSKAINGPVKTIEWHSYQAIQDKGLISVKKDIETYDDKGRLSSVLTENYQNNQRYKTIYTLNKKGLLTQTQIINPSNNLALRTTSYEYKKSILIKTIQTQGANTIVKNYTYNKKGQLVAVEVKQNGTLSLNEYYELDDENRRTKISRKLPNDTEAKVSATFNYELKDGKLISTENRNTDNGRFVITKTTVAENRRDISEVTKRVSDGQQATNLQFFEDDEKGNWIKGEVIADQYSRSRLVLRKFTFFDDTESGRVEMKFPDDYHAQFIRRYSQKQVAVNGKVYNSGTAFALDYTDDRLVYVANLNSWILLKDFDKNNNMTQWAEAQVIGGGRDEVFWAASSSGISVFNAGRKYTKGTGKNNYSAYPFGNSFTAYIRGNVNQSFLVKDAAGNAGKVIKAQLTSDHFHWGKVSDSTYVLANRGRSVGLQKQIEDTEGNKLAMFKQGNLYYWYFLPGFRSKFNNSEVGEIHAAESVYDPTKFLTEDKLKADLGNLNYTKLANARYRLLSADGISLTNIASRTIKTPDDKLFAYFPLTNQYLLMEKFYGLEQDKEWPNQKVSIVSDSTAYVYYMYNENKSINFYTPEGRIEKRAFANHKLDPNKRMYAAVVYDSTNNVSYGMNYDLDNDAGFGPMRKLPANARGAYIIKLEGGRWVILEKGIKVKDYTFSKQSKNGAVVHFFKDDKGKTQALEFRQFSNAHMGDILYGIISLESDLEAYIKEFGIDPGLKKSEVEELSKGNPLTFDREGNMLYVRDSKGNDIGHKFSWFVTKGTGDDLIAYDSVAKNTYRIYGFYANQDITDGKVKKVVSAHEFRALKWGKSSIYLSMNGIFQKDVSRSFITQNPEDKTWVEVFYDQSEAASYQLSYPSDSNFYVLNPEVIPPSHNHAYVFRTNQKNFVMIEKGVLVRNKQIRSRVLGNDLLRMIPHEGGVKGYLFKGYKSADMLELIPALAMTDDQLKAAWEKAGEELKEQGPESSMASALAPNDKWMSAINQCGTNVACTVKLINELATAARNSGKVDQEVTALLVPYMAAIGKKNREHLFNVVMKVDAKYTGVMLQPNFPKDLKDFIKKRSSQTVDDYIQKNGKPQIKTTANKKKGSIGL